MSDVIIKPHMEFLNKELIEARDYQIAIAEKCVGKNSLVVLPTGLGKTIITLFIAAKTLEHYPAGCKIIIMEHMILLMTLLDTLLMAGLLMVLILKQK